MTDKETTQKTYKALKEAQTVIRALISNHPDMQTWKNTPYKYQQALIQEAIDTVDMSS